jgi:hypothetical protein
MFSCDYNGWADVPEEEREGIEVFEAAQPIFEASILLLVLESPPVPALENLECRAA